MAKAPKKKKTVKAAKKKQPAKKTVPKKASKKAAPKKQTAKKAAPKKGATKQGTTSQTARVANLAVAGPGFEFCLRNGRRVLVPAGTCGTQPGDQPG
jgi:hypothetical protein